MRVLTIGRLPLNEVGGLPLYTANLAAALGELGVEQLVVHPGPDVPTGSYPFATRAPLPRTWPERGRLRSFREAFAAGAEARRAIADFAPDVVHLQYGGAMDLALLNKLACTTGVPPIVVTAHCGRAWAHLGRFPRASVKVLRAADRVLAISADQRELFASSGLPSERLFQIGSLVESEFFGPTNEAVAMRAYRSTFGERPRAAYLGRIAPEKGLELVIAALAQLPAEARPTFTATGPVAPDYAEQLLVLARSAGVEDSFHLAPPVSSPADRRAILDGADLLVHPTLSDVKPLVVIEAMARALPVIASALPGTVELLDGAGASFPVGDAAGLAAALSSFREARPTGLAGRRVAEAYTPAAAAAETLAHFRDLVPNLRGVA